MRTDTTSLTGTPTDTRPLLYEVTGHGDPIVLMPGGLTGWASFVTVAERLAGSHTVIRAQLRHVELAEAGKPVPETHAVAIERDALLATVDLLDFDRFDLLGWSSGGAASLAFALAHPGRVRTLTLVEPAAFWILRETGHALDALAIEDAWFRTLVGKQVTVDDLKSFLVRAGLGDEHTDFEAHPRWPIMVRNRQSLAVGAAEIDHTDSIASLRALDIPILAVKGTDTAEFLGAVIDDIATIAPNVTLLELPGGHACHLENLDRFLAALEAHIAEA